MRFHVSCAWHIACQGSSFAADAKINHAVKLALAPSQFPRDPFSFANEDPEGVSIILFYRIIFVSALIGSVGACTTEAGDKNPAGTGGALAGTGGSIDGATGGAGTGGAGTGGAGTGGVTGTGGDDPGSGGESVGTGGDDAGTGGEGMGTGGDEGMETTPLGGIPMGNDPVPSAGCGSPAGMTSGNYQISSAGANRDYILDIPDDYDPNTPHKLYYTSHWINGQASWVRDAGFYGLKPRAEADGVPAIFIAPQSDDGTWALYDHDLFDNLLALAKENFCIDETRVFATGFSFGGMITFSLSLNHQDEIRAAVGIAPANYNIDLPERTDQPIAWMQTTGMADDLTPWVNNEQQQRGAKFIAMEHGTNNGCDVPDPIPTWQNGGRLCVDFEGCDPAFPTKICTFNGGHVDNASDGDGNWISAESWAFFQQF